MSLPLSPADLILGLLLVFSLAINLTQWAYGSGLKAPKPIPSLAVSTHTHSGPEVSIHEMNGRPIHVGQCTICGQPFRLEG